jgi:hypothetical protein
MVTETSSNSNQQRKKQKVTTKNEIEAKKQAVK